MNNFTPRAQEVLKLSRKEADRFNHGYIGTEHLLLGLIALGEGVAVNILRQAGLDLETVRMEVEKAVGVGSDMKTVGKWPLYLFLYTTDGADRRGRVRSRGGPEL